jgi:hypothetical protein
MRRDSARQKGQAKRTNGRPLTCGLGGTIRTDEIPYKTRSFASTPADEGRILSILNGSCSDTPPIEGANCLLWEQVVQPNPKCADEMQQFKIPNPSLTCLDLGDCVPANVPALPLADCRQCGLRKTPLEADAPHLWTNDVFFDIHERARMST